MTRNEAGKPGDPGVDPGSGLTPGPVECLDKQLNGSSEVITCQIDVGYWSNARQCYQRLADPQSPPPEGFDPVGAWYDCSPPPAPACSPTGQVCLDQWGTSNWLLTPPPGITTLTPGQAARSLVASFALTGITVGFAPDPTVAGSKSYVGVPIWMWAANPTPLSYGPYVQSTTLGGVTITATAQVSSIVWNMGDGTTVACANAGTPFVVAYGAVDSPTCGHRYARTSAAQPGGTFPITATSQWQVSWEGGGESGVIPLTTTATSAVRINEIQSVNVGAGG
ncbi:hypothetical protein [Cryobacterium zongtaii]|uniref:hypothetical protein n=1 Tax=Cryobacterium zongtaii TaxID=1259217 RepID=UPI001FAFF1CD|nr:hypothetical protein [Cryobacterium zongtaii]